MESNCLVSVVVPTFRRDEMLERALDSLGKQTYPAIEVIVVDDNHNEEWNEKVNETITRVKKKYPGLELRCVVNKENLGSAETRNTGIMASKGEYVTFLDDDDVYMPEKTERQLADMRAADADYGITDLELYNGREKLIGRRKRGYLRAFDSESLLRCHLMYHLTGTDTLMFKRDYLLKIGMFPHINIGDEFYLMERAITAGGRFCYSPHCYVKAYVHDIEDAGLSAGDEKIAGENGIFEAKKKYFDRLDRGARRYIVMRHYAVLAYAEYCRKNFLRAVADMLRAFLANPQGFVNLRTVLK